MVRRSNPNIERRSGRGNEDDVGLVRPKLLPHLSAVPRRATAGLVVFTLVGLLLAGCVNTAPAPPPVEPSPIHRTAAREHTVVPGETIASIARLHEVKAESILRANPSVEPERLPVGTVLEIPVRKPVIRRVQSLSPAGEEVGP